MALTPEDVVNKRFQPTKFREGYDQDEVDDFLDEVVVELRRLNQENEELRQRIIQSDSRISQLQQSAPVQHAVTAAPAPPVAAPVPAPVPTPSYNAGLEDQSNTNNLLQLARTLHEQHVREGVEKRDALIAEGQATATRLVQEAEEEHRSKVGNLEQERHSLEVRIDELRNFERDYRAKLKGYIEGQLRELDDSGAPAASQSPSPSEPAQSAPVQAAPVQAAPPQGAPGHAAPPQAAPPQAAPDHFTGDQGFGQQQPAPPAPPAFGGGAEQQQVPQGYPGFGGN